MKKNKSTEDTLENQNVNIFDVLDALDKKDYGYYDRLTYTQQKSISFYMLVQWMSAVTGKKDIQQYYLQSVEYHTNKYLFNEYIKNHPNVIWLMLCAASPGLGKQFHQWVPKISEKVCLLKENASVSDTKKYYQKVYPKANEEDINELTNQFVTEQKKKVVLGKIYPTLKLDEIELLSTIVTDNDIDQHERDSGN